jgi:uncharacterized NAD-dependent epimerase/dehydratase family protein
VKLAILAEGQLAPATAKTAIGVLRYAPYPVVAIVDSTKAGSEAFWHVGVGKGVPIVATVDEAIALGAEALLIGTAAAGGRIADAYRPHLLRALERGLTIWNGLHERVLSDPSLAAAAKRGSATVRELREPPVDLPIGGHRARREGAIVVLTIGTDAAVGKMTASLEIVEALRRMGQRAAFVATGQTGIAIAGEGIAVDAVVADFIAGAAEKMVCDAAESAEYVIVEGQGSLAHPGFSGVTLGLLHGSAPHFMVLCHDAARPVMKGYEQERLRVRSLSDSIRMSEEAAAWSRAVDAERARVIAIALNTARLTGDLARGAIVEAGGETDLPAADPIRDGAAGADLLARAVVTAADARRAAAR